MYKQLFDVFDALTIWGDEHQLKEVRNFLDKNPTNGNFKLDIDYNEIPLDSNKIEIDPDWNWNWNLNWNSSLLENLGTSAIMLKTMNSFGFHFLKEISAKFPEVEFGYNFNSLDYN